MFEVGKRYRLTMISYDHEAPMTETHHGCEVMEVQLPLVKFVQHRDPWIVNTNAPTFVDARPE